MWCFFLGVLLKKRITAFDVRTFLFWLAKTQIVQDKINFAAFLQLTRLYNPRCLKMYVLLCLQLKWTFIFFLAKSFFHECMYTVIFYCGV